MQEKHVPKKSDTVQDNCGNGIVTKEIIQQRENKHIHILNITFCTSNAKLTGQVTVVVGMTNSTGTKHVTFSSHNKVKFFSINNVSFL